MEQNKAKVGMLVLYNGEECGIIRDIDDDIIGVEFFKFKYGRHSLDNTIKSNNGYWLSVKYLEPAKLTWKEYFDLLGGKNE